MSDAELEKLDSQEIWVDIYEAAERTGYSVDGMRKVAQRIGRQPEEEREIKMRKRTSRWELWLPDVIDYVQRPIRGARSKQNQKPLDN
jgi:hypothetical protein